MGIPHRFREGMALAAILLGTAGLSVTAQGQTSAAEAPTCTVAMWSTCDLVFPLQPGDDPARSELRAEFRSPHRDSRTLRAFHEGQTLVLRFSPDEAGTWDYRVTSTVRQWDAKIGHLTASPSAAAGFVRTANTYHFQTANLQPHLWMGSEIGDFVAMPRATFDTLLAQRASELFNHLRVTIPRETDMGEAAERIRAINARSIVADVVLGDVPEAVAERQRYVTEMVARFGAFNITWAGIPALELGKGRREIAADTGRLIADLDAYKHPRTSMAEATSAPLWEDRAANNWINVLSYGTADPNIGAVERQFYRLPAVSTGIRSRADLWNATMNGQYPTSGQGREFTVWYEFMSKNRHWELEPYFNLQGGRAIALPEVPEDIGVDGIDAVEYIVYVEKPGPVELTVGNRGYDVVWIDPATGARTKVKDTKVKDLKDPAIAKFSVSPPDLTHDWVLHVSREGRKEGMLKSYKFESRRMRSQEPETAAAKIPYDIELPAGDISLRAPSLFKLKSTRANREPRNLLVEWTAEVVTSGEGYRVVGKGLEGSLQFPPALAEALAPRLPAVLSLRVMILNSTGQAYAIDRAFRLVP